MDFFQLEICVCDNRYIIAIFFLCAFPKNLKGNTAAALLQVAPLL